MPGPLIQKKGKRKKAESSKSEQQKKRQKATEQKYEYREIRRFKRQLCRGI